MYLNDKNVIHPHVVEIVWKEVEKDETNWQNDEKTAGNYFSLSIQQSILRSIPLS